MIYFLVSAVFCVAIAACSPYKPPLMKDVHNHEFDGIATEESIKHLNKLNHSEFFMLHDKRWMLSPDGDNKPRVAALNASKIARRSTYEMQTSVTIYLYTRENINDGQVMKMDMASLNSSNFNASNPTKCITHGFRGSYTADYCQTLKNAFLRTGVYNIFLVDWSPFAKGYDYPAAANMTKDVGMHIAELIDFLADNGVRPEDMHCLGFSLGAHAVAVAAQHCISGKVARITGLDPALPLFEVPAAPDIYRLDFTDADFVEIIHTSGGSLGYMLPHGHVDFYPGGGVAPQAGCLGDDLACSHFRSYQYYEEAILYPGSFMAVKCSNMAMFRMGMCKGNPVIPMGFNTPTDARGDYMCIVNCQSPFGRGDPGKDEKLF